MFRALAWLFLATGLLHTVSAFMHGGSPDWGVAGPAVPLLVELVRRHRAEVQVTEDAPAG